MFEHRAMLEFFDRFPRSHAFERRQPRRPRSAVARRRRRQRERCFAVSLTLDELFIMLPLSNVYATLYIIGHQRQPGLDCYDSHVGEAGRDTEKLSRDKDRQRQRTPRLSHVV